MIHGSITDVILDGVSESLLWIPLCVPSFLFLLLASYYLSKIIRIKAPFMIKEESLCFAMFGLFCISLCMFYIFSPMTVIPDYGNRRLLVIFVATFSYLVSVYFFPLVAVIRARLLVHKIPVSESSMMDTIDNPKMWRSLKEHITRDYCLESALFLEEMNYVEPGEISLNSRKIRSIYLKYIDRDAPLQVNISSKLREELEKHFKNQTIQIQHLDQVYNCIFESIYMNSFPMFWKQLNE